MKKFEFNQITNLVKAKTKHLQELRDLYYKSGKFDFDSLTISQLKEVLKEARELQSTTDKFLQTDLYHILGMGNLSATQTSELCKMVKDMTVYRSMLKALCSIAVSIPEEVNLKPTYKLGIAKGVRLTRNLNL